MIKEDLGFQGLVLTDDLVFHLFVVLQVDQLDGGAKNNSPRLKLGWIHDLGIRELTVYSFSTENWSRPAEEVSGLMAMMRRRIELETPELHDEGVLEEYNVKLLGTPLSARSGR